MVAATVLDEITAKIAILSGAEVMESPSFDKEIAELCNLHRIPYMPGCMTVSALKLTVTWRL